MRKIVRLPGRLSSDVLDQFVSDVFDPHGEPTADRFHFELNGLDFIDGIGLTTLCNVLDRLLDVGVAFDFEPKPASAAAILYLDDSGFFETYSGESLFASRSRRETTLPCRRLITAQSFEWTERQFAPWLANVLRTEPDQLASLKSALREIFANISDHSTKQIGCVHVQHYPRVQKVGITIADFGRGIPDTIREKFGPMSDGEALAKSVTRGVTVGSKPGNRGEGLGLLLDYVTGNSGDVDIYSRRGRLACRRAEGGTVRQWSRSDAGFYPGTMIDINLRTDLFVGDEPETETFEW